MRACEEFKGSSSSDLAQAVGVSLDFVLAYPACEGLPFKGVTSNRVRRAPRQAHSVFAFQNQSAISNSVPMELQLFRESIRCARTANRSRQLRRSHFSRSTGIRRLFRVTVSVEWEPAMPMWLIIQLVSIAAMPAAYDMALDRGRSTRAWLWTALIFGPLALLALLILGKRNNQAVWTVP